MTEVDHAMATLAASSLGAPCPLKYIRDAMRALKRAGLIDSLDLSADRAYTLAKESLNRKG